MRARWRLFLGLLLLLFSCALFVLAWGNDAQDLLATVNARWADLRTAVQEHPVVAAFLFFLAYVAFTGLSLPGALFLTVLGGALFGTVWATCLVSFASSLGASLAFLLSRYLLRDWVTTRYQDRWQAARQEIDQSGGYYLLAMRLNPLVPYFLINLFFGLTRMPVWRFWFISQVGMLPATILYTYAGAQLGRITTLQGLVSQEMILALVLLSLFPLAARWVAKRVLVRPQSPKS
jgi:uncharacterized membrane protein YdjX (TVP38/TMEM64 family)